MRYSYVLRPSFFRTTPNKIAAALGDGCQAVTYDEYDELDNPRGNIFPMDQRRTGARKFYFSSKGEQRRILTNYGVKTPDSYRQGATRFVVRPSYHSGGQSYRVTSDSNDYNRSAGEYISPVFPKVRELRVIFCFGTPIIYLYKNPPSDSDPELPWNFERGSEFTTYTRTQPPILRTTFLEDCTNIPWLKEPGLIGADVMMDRHDNYAVCEFNFVPAIEINTNLQRIVDHAHSRS